MASASDTRIGQLAIARGLIGLAELLRCVEEAGRSNRELGDVLVSSGFLSGADLLELENRLAADGDAGVQRELEQGATVVLDELTRSRADLVTLEVEPLDGPLPTRELVDMDLELAHEDRYELQEELGRGGMGRVFLATDRILQRKVALKTLVEEARTEKGRTRLLVEAQVTGLLEHPSIVPVYDLRAARDGEPFYTMRVVRERNLNQILQDIAAGSSEYSLTNLVNILRQVSLAVQFAHDLGVVHRDLKPENILVGSYGEVYVIDWGVAKIVNSDIGLTVTGKLMMGQLVGTPQYMAPEQARGDNEAVDERSDVYALGAILYEILTLESVFDADHLLAVLFQVVHDSPIPPAERAPSRQVPAELAEICMRALRKDPEQRFQKAQEFADELELFLEGVKERERRRQMAQEAIEQASQFRAVYDDVRAQHSATLRELSEERKTVESWAGAERKARLWSLEQQAEDLEVEIERRFGEVVRVYGQALVHVPEMAAARRALADLYWERFREYETSGRFAQAAYFETLVRQYNDGAYDELLEGNGLLDIETQPQGATAVLYRFQPVERRLVEWRVADFAPTPTVGVAVPHGSYLVELSRSGFRTVRVPVVIGRGESHHVRARLYPESEVPSDFEVIPAGDFLTGRLTPGIEARREYLPDYAIARYPVTNQEYVDFLNDLVAEGREDEAARYEPTDGTRLYWPRGDDGRYFLPEKDPQGDSWDPSCPVILVNLASANAFAVWRARKQGRKFRLPTLREWEKAARGVDGRVFSWGNHFDPAFCMMRGSVKGRALPAPVGSFPIDRSPYGIYDVCGNVAQWTSTAEPGSGDVHYLAGASYNSFAEMCRLDFVLSSPVTYSFGHYGFRLAMDLPND